MPDFEDPRPGLIALLTCSLVAPCAANNSHNLVVDQDVSGGNRTFKATCGHCGKTASVSSSDGKVSIIAPSVGTAGTGT